MSVKRFLARRRRWPRGFSFVMLWRSRLVFGFADIMDFRFLYQSRKDPVLLNLFLFVALCLFGNLLNFTFSFSVFTFPFLLLFSFSLFLLLLYSFSFFFFYSFLSFSFFSSYNLTFYSISLLFFYSTLSLPEFHHIVLSNSKQYNFDILLSISNHARCMANQT